MLFRPWVVVLGASFVLFLVNFVFLPTGDRSSLSDARGRSPFRGVAPSPVAPASVVVADSALALLIGCLQVLSRVDVPPPEDVALAALFAEGGHGAVYHARCVPLADADRFAPFTQAYGLRAAIGVRTVLALVPQRVELDRRLLGDVDPAVAWRPALAAAAATLGAYREHLVAVHDAVPADPATLEVYLPVVP